MLDGCLRDDCVNKVKVNIPRLEVIKNLVSSGEGRFGGV